MTRDKIDSLIILDYLRDPSSSIFLLFSYCSSLSFVEAFYELRNGQAKVRLQDAPLLTID